MFGRKKEVREVRRSNPSSLSQYGLLDIPGIDNSGFDINEGGADDDDDALEAELLALTSGSTSARPRKKPAPAKPSVNLDSMVAESLRDIPSDDDISVDENDPALLNELNDLVDDDDMAVALPSIQSQSKSEPPKEDILTLLRDRQKMYEEAERNAKSSGETARARRFSRGIKTLNDMIKQASAGRVINEEEIPPPVITSVKRKSSVDVPSDGSPAPAVPSRPAPPPPVPAREPFRPIEPLTDESGAASAGGGGSTEVQAASSSSPAGPADPAALQVLLARRNEFKEAALEAKRNGDSSKALRYVKIVKQFEPVIAAAAAGQPVDLSSIPPPPAEFDAQGTIGGRSPMKENAEQQQSPDNAANMIGEVAEMMANAAAAAQEDNPTSDEPVFDAPPAPTTVLEALEQRLAKYRSAEQAAKDEGNSSKTRRMGRIVKQYESAIKQHKAGKPIPVDELPTPPGFGPIPVEGAGAPAASPAPPAGRVSTSVAADTVPAAPASPASPAGPAALKPQVGSPAPAEAEPSGAGTRPNVRKSPQSRQEKQLALLLSRQKKFREAAVEAKRKGEVNQAKEYLRIMKGFDPLIEASQNGLPIDLASLPIPPENKVELETDFDVVNLEDCLPGTDTEIYEKLEEDLLRQTKMCLTTRDHFKATGDIASANRFEQLALHSKKDLDAVKCAHKRSDPVPKFHYETRTFNIVQCCTELGDNDLELSIVQGINYNVPNPKEVDTYVKFEFPFPAETPVKDRTGLIKDTNNPQYNQTFLLSIQRNVRACQRVFKRQAVKLEVWSRGSVCHRLCCFLCLSGTKRESRAGESSGFFRGDTLIGTASVKLMPLETKCTIHDAYDLMDGRKAVGGKLEVKIRVRNPILAKQVEKVQEKWLVIDQYL